MSEPEYLGIESFLRAIGYSDELEIAQAWLTLERSGLLEPQQQFLYEAQWEAARKILRPNKLQVCSVACAYSSGILSELDLEKQVVSPKMCQSCQGSANLKSIKLMLSTLVRFGIRRVLIVGGYTPQCNEINRLTQGSPVSFRFLDGMKSSGIKTAVQLKSWSDLVVLWTRDLRHSQSYGFTNEKDKQLIIVRKGQIRGFCLTIVKYFDPQNVYLGEL